MTRAGEEVIDRDVDTSVDTEPGFGDETGFEIRSDDPDVREVVSAVGMALEQLRRTRGKPVAWLAERLNVEPDELSRLEDDESLPLATLVRCLIALDCSFHDLANTVDEIEGRRSRPMPEAHEEEDEGLQCSFCDKSQDEVKKLIAGPTVFICDGCADAFLEDVRASREPDRRPLSDKIGKIVDEKALRCSFCFKSEWEVDQLIAGPGHEDFICDWCVYGSVDAFDLDKPPAAVGAYRLEERVEGHSTGTVWRGHDEERDRPVFIKRLIPPCHHLLALDAAKARDLDHPSIVSTYDILRNVEGHDWIVTEPAEGKTLKQKLSDNWLGRREPLELLAVVRLAREIAEGTGGGA